MANVAFEFEVEVSGNIDDARININHLEFAWDSVEDGVRKKKVAGNYPVGRLAIFDILLMGQTGSDFKIEYSCSADGVKREDATNTSPIEEIIVSGNNRIVRIKIKA